MQKLLMLAGLLSAVLLMPAYGSGVNPDSELTVEPVLQEAPLSDTALPMATEAETAEAAPATAKTERVSSRLSLSDRDKVLQPGTDTISPSSSLLKIVISLALVVTFVIGLGWLFKKMSLKMPGSRQIKIISALPLGQRERILVIEIQGKQRVIGVTPHSINLLFELENPLPDEKLASDFHTQLQSFLKK